MNNDRAFTPWFGRTGADQFCDFERCSLNIKHYVQRHPERLDYWSLLDASFEGYFDIVIAPLILFNSRTVNKTIYGLKDLFIKLFTTAEGYQKILEKYHNIAEEYLLSIQHRSFYKEDAHKALASLFDRCHTYLEIQIDGENPFKYISKHLLENLASQIKKLKQRTEIISEEQQGYEYAIFSRNSSDNFPVNLFLELLYNNGYNQLVKTAKIISQDADLNPGHYNVMMTSLLHREAYFTAYLIDYGKLGAKRKKTLVQTTINQIQSLYKKAETLGFNNKDLGAFQIIYNCLLKRYGKLVPVIGFLKMEIVYRYIYHEGFLRTILEAQLPGAPNGGKLFLTGPKKIDELQYFLTGNFSKCSKWTVNWDPDAFHYLVIKFIEHKANIEPKLLSKKQIIRFANGSYFSYGSFRNYLSDLEISIINVRNGILILKTKQEYQTFIDSLFDNYFENVAAQEWEKIQ